MKGISSVFRTGGSVDASGRVEKLFREVSQSALSIVSVALLLAAWLADDRRDVGRQQACLADKRMPGHCRGRTLCKDRASFQQLSCSLCVCPEPVLVSDSFPQGDHCEEKKRRLFFARAPPPASSRQGHLRYQAACSSGNQRTFSSVASEPSWPPCCLRKYSASFELPLRRRTERMKTKSQTKGRRHHANSAP